ncbi:hypothetical protein DEVEQU_00645 [Devosia equisanguinis]|uniref:DUF2066 domain-containing protein n=1 Tax=Devosia equisanguinis TaxID=2490941 RepID=A0A3S4CA01_9HYPH|nr:hypothetical protein [Devosia equisanguinis]VDS03522.1 hypothetical protein DEVEQU_00645 [Devosia equisanguinis]
MNKHFVSMVTAIMLLIGSMMALPAWAQDRIVEAAEAFVAAEGFEVMPLEHIEGALGDLLGGDPNAMVPLDADISPLEKALLLTDLQEEPLPRLRYLLRYNQQTVDGVVLSLISVERFNLGPAIRVETALAYGEENTAPPEAFGVGPSVIWRFVTQPTAKSAALLLAASRRELTEKSATRRNCLIRACLSLDTIDALADWREWQPLDAALPEVAYPPLTPSTFSEGEEELRPAVLALQVALAAGLASQDAEGIVWNMPERQGGENETPLIALLIDRNLGQDIMTDAALGVGKMGLDSEEYWTRIAGGYFGGQTQWQITTAQGPLR